MSYNRTATNPTVRITNLLEEIADLRDWIDFAITEQSFTHQIPPPVASSFEAGFRSARSRPGSHGTYEKQTEKHRIAMRLSRIRRSSGYNIRSSTPYTGLTPAQQAAIDAEIEALSAPPTTTTDTTDA